LAGSILDGRSDWVTDVQARSIDLIAHGAGSAWRAPTQDLRGRRSAVAQCPGDQYQPAGHGPLFAEADGDIYLSEVDQAMRVLKAFRRPERCG